MRRKSPTDPAGFNPDVAVHPEGRGAVPARLAEREVEDCSSRDPASLKVGTGLVDVVELVARGHQAVELELTRLVPVHEDREVDVGRAGAAEAADEALLAEEQVGGVH